MKRRRRKFLEGTKIEKVYYELKPFFMLAIGSFILKNLDLITIGRIGATLLLLCGMLILIERARYRGYLK